MQQFIDLKLTHHFMNTRFRLLIIGLGALLVALTYSFPLWYPLLQNQETTFPFPELDPELHDAFLALPLDRQRNYLAVREVDLSLALNMANTGLLPDDVVPQEDQVLPQISGQQETGITGEFINVTPNRGAVGTVKIYELPDGGHYLWFEDFDAIRGPDLRIYLSTHSSLSLEDLDDDEELALSPDDIALGRLEMNSGNQRFNVPRGVDLAMFNSVIIFSQGLNLIYSIADI